MNQYQGYLSVGFQIDRELSGDMAQSVSGQYQGYESVSRLLTVNRTASSNIDSIITVSSNKNWDVVTVVIRVTSIRVTVCSRVL